MAHDPGRTIFPLVSKEDPKHGRWILPLVVLALWAFTFTFVNALPPAENVNTTVAGAETTTTTEPPPETTTTTLAPEVVEFLAAAEALSGQATDMNAQAGTINEEFPDVTGYSATKDLLSQLRADTTAFEETVAALTIPAAAAEQWSNVTTSATAMRIAADDMLDGLVNSSGSEKRLAALDSYNIAAATFAQAVDSAKAAATGS